MLNKMINFQERLLFMIIQEFIYYLVNKERIFIQRELNEAIYLEQLLEQEINNSEDIYNTLYEYNDF